MSEEEHIDNDSILRVKANNPFFKAILRARRAYLESGRKLLSFDEIEEEIGQLRGGIQEEQD
ncbi:hypothetical protein D6810_00995 [Candidatus Dojkabacteria bacterium]|jgi:hypothetical protein|uniref:Uncharacterized protein n=1 Tax=Candidatus Dojkabacteria bacterium TaxID=2099670 RepID=A0A3M0Z395_9BACT|nr:MAG: hypothetical protein D6810_00995 [Candidatus Dojkabacteria bacterium]